MVQFLMKLRPEFESIRGSLLNREVTPALDVVLAVVLCEETRLGTQAAIESMPLPVVALLAQKSTIDYWPSYFILSSSSNLSRPSHQAYQTDVTKSTGSFPSGHDLERLIRDSTEAALPGAISSALSASSGQLVDQNHVVKFSPNDCVVQNLKTGMTVAKGRRVGGMFLLESVHHHLHNYFLSVSAANVTRSNKLLTLWHNRMGHPRSSRLQHMLKSCIPATRDIHSSLPLTCSNCAGSKSHKLPFPSCSSSYDDLFDLVHSDV
ncbi:hypothetical protein KY284_013106 [Solanum tuberosum]|nr:hypothetical protein KY284_013106 [Solanum tuberosum]